MWIHIFNLSLHQMVVKWIGRAACDGGAFAGIGSACKGAQAANMGMVVLVLLAMGLGATWLNIRRRRRRTEYFW
jgi:hypothetical protein